jgi:hypothetical protein
MQLDIILTFRKQSEHTEQREQIISSGKKKNRLNFFVEA